MITVQDVKDTSFRKSMFGGYRPEDVDDFIDKILDYFEESEREKRNLNLVIQKLEEKIRKFHEEEKSIKEIVSDLKNVVDRSISEAEIRSKDILDKASESSENMIKSAKEEVCIQREISNNLKKESKRLKESLEEVYKKHLEIMKSIPYISDSNVKIEDTTFDVDNGAVGEKKVNENKTSDGTLFKFQNLEFGDKYRNNSI